MYLDKNKHILNKNPFKVFSCNPCIQVKNVTFWTNMRNQIFQTLTFVLWK